MKKTQQHYVDNQEFFKEIVSYKLACAKADAKKKERPRMSEYIGECFLKIATHLSYKPNFMNYTFRDDMISDGVENCLTYALNFNEKKSKNPFGYFTQVVFYAFIRRIQREKKHTYVKYKLLEKALIDGSTHEHSEDGGQLAQDTTSLTFDNVSDFINKFDEYSLKRRERRRVTKQKADAARV